MTASTGAPAYPGVRYHPEGRTTRVEDASQDRNLMAQGWSDKPFPPAPEETQPMGIFDQIKDLTRRVEALEGKKKKG